MADFAKYYLDFVWSLGENFLKFFEAVFIAIAHVFSKDIPDYFFKLGEAIKGFDVLGWITLFLVTIINFVLAFFIFYRLFLSLRKYIFIRHKEVEKEELLEEISKLKEQTEQLALEKNKIFSLKLNELNAFSGEIGGAKKEEKEVKGIEGRFTKLAAIDKKYNNNPAFINMSDSDMLTLEELVDNFVFYSASQLKLYYSKDVIRQFIAGLATSKVIIIEGISGTGKTSLPYAVSKYFFNNALIVSVQPSWRDRAELLGYLNEFTKKFNETDFLSGLYEATYRDDMNFIVLDEMNLARIEYYFAEFLSIMEMPDTSEWKIDIVPSREDGDPKNLVDGKLTVPQNIWFVGTANQDDSTFTITDKVYDRAVTIQLNEKGKYFDAPITQPVNFSHDYLDSLFNKAMTENELSQQALDKLEKLDDFIQKKFKIAFGNRILKQIKLFVPVYVACGGAESEGLDFMVMTKILKKFTSLNLVFLTKELTELVTLMEKLFGKGKFSKSIEYLKQLQKTV
ncbi:MAG: hypothetical protein PHC84_04290 [Clostridia bacterium]|nr:hypothetical protein [Clostridia bacterium]